MKSKTILPVCLAVLFAGLTATRSAAAITVGPKDNIQIGGFFSQGYLYSSENNFPTTSLDGTWDFREAALNVSTTIGSHLRLGAQGFAQRFGSIGRDKVILDWAVADYNFRPEFGIRAGRVKYPKGLYGEALDLDVVRPFVFLPTAVYNPVLRDFSASFDGAMVYGSFGVGRGSVDYKLFYGDIPISPEKGVAEFYNNSGLYSLAAGGTNGLAIDSVMGGQLAWNTPVNGLKAVYSYSEYADLSTSGPFGAYPAANLWSNFAKFSWHTASVEYVTGNWVLAAEWQQCGGKLDYGAPPVLPTVHDSSGWTGWYLSAARRLNDRFEVGAYYGQLLQRYEGSTSDPRRHQYDSALSVRFDLNEHVLFKVEAHYFEGTYQTFNTTRIPNPASTRRNHNTVIAAKTTLSF